METDPVKLVTTVAGSNYRTIEGSADIVLKPDSEYPDWLWTMNVERPLPMAKDMPKGTLEYYEKLHEEEKARRRRLSQGKRFYQFKSSSDRIYEIH